MSYTIVAIPSKDDYVWKISSEKIPHITILALGDNLGNLNKVMEYVGHTVDVSLTRFGLSVDHRGTLGPQEADVLFFDDYCIDKLKDVRSYFLQDPSIFIAYNTTPQFESWTPHLTLGYPKTPAKPDPRDYPGIGWINFDTIALWTGDHEGVEFPLKTQNDSVAAYSESGAEFLAHYGIKGMKWGVHRQGAERIAVDAGAAAANLKRNPTKATFRANTKAAGGLHKVNDKDLRAMLDRMDMEKRFSKMMQEDADRRREGLKAVARILGESGKILLPIVATVVANQGVKNYAATGSVFRSARAGARVIEGSARALGS